MCLHTWLHLHYALYVCPPTYFGDWGGGVRLKPNHHGMSICLACPTHAKGSESLDSMFVCRDHRVRTPSREPSLMCSLLVTVVFRSLSVSYTL